MPMNILGVGKYESLSEQSESIYGYSTIVQVNTEQL